jgi:hypothetical protein
MATIQHARRRPAKRAGSLTLAGLSELDLENVAQVELRNYFETHPASVESNGERAGANGGRSGRAAASGRNGNPEKRARILFELERLIRRARRETARATALEAHAREEHRLRGLGDWDVSREALERLRNRMTEFDRRHPVLTRRGRLLNPMRDAWRLWDGQKAPVRETLVIEARGASRREIHLEILARHRRVQRDIRDRVARLQPRARPQGSLFRLVYRPDQHELLLISAESTTTI